MSFVGIGKEKFTMRIRDLENVLRHRRIPYPKRSVEFIALIAISCTLFLFLHTKNLNSRLKEMEVKLQPSEFSALGLTGDNHIDDSKHHHDRNTLHGTYQYLKSTGQIHQLYAKTLNNTPKAQKDLLYFNWVPRNGGKQFIEFMGYLADEHGFSTGVLPASKGLSPRYSKYYQEDLAKDISKLEDFSQFSMHMNFINFTEFKFPRPIYVNLVRDPIERVISWFYYRRSPSVVAQMYKRNKKFNPISWYKKSFEECVLGGDPECQYVPGSDFEQVYDHRRQTLFFCGHSKECEPFNSEVALQMAKRTVETEYAVVGSLEDLNVTLSVLEGYVPKYFKDATRIYYENMWDLKLNENGWKPSTIKEEVRNIMKKNFTMEYEFYHFCKQRLYNQFLALKVGQ